MSKQRKGGHIAEEKLISLCLWMARIPGAVIDDLSDDVSDHYVVTIPNGMVVAVFDDCITGEFRFEINLGDDRAIRVGMPPDDDPEQYWDGVEHRPDDFWADFDPWELFDKLSGDDPEAPIN